MHLLLRLYPDLYHSWDLSNVSKLLPIYTFLFMRNYYTRNILWVACRTIIYTGDIQVAVNGAACSRNDLLLFVYESVTRKLRHDICSETAVSPEIRRNIQTFQIHQAVGLLKELLIHKPLIFFNYLLLEGV